MSTPAKDKSRRQIYEEEFEKAVQSLSKDVPLLLHGSGDVAPSQVNPATVHLVASLTAQYIAQLVDASLDSHFNFLDNPEAFRVPPPSFPKRRMPSKPPPFSVTHAADANQNKILSTANSDGLASTGTNSAGGAAASGITAEENDTAPASNFLKKKLIPRKRLREEYWDDGVGKPKIKSQIQSNAAAATETIPSEDSASVSNHDFSQVESPENRPLVPLEEWVGAIGVDLRENWIRKAHVKNAIATPSFVFPIYHDVYAYNRVREMRAAKRTLDPLLQDSTVNEMIKTEGRRSRVRDNLNAKKKEEDAEEDDDVAKDDDVDGEPEWPGLDMLLPVHLIKDFLT